MEATGILFEDLQALWAYLVAFAVPFVTGFISKGKWSSWAKFGVLLALSGVIGAVTTALTGNEWTWEWSVPFFLSVAMAAQIYFIAFVDAIPNLKGWLARNGNR